MRRAAGLVVLALLLAALILNPAWFDWLFAPLTRNGAPAMYTHTSLLRLTLSHLAIVALSVSVSVLIAVPAAIWVTRGAGREFLPLVRTLVGIGQTFPPVAVLALAVPMMGFGAAPTFLALTLYGLLPIFENSLAALSNLPAPVVEAALASARKMGVISVLNVAPLTADAARLARMADIVIANETEFALLTGTEFSEAALVKLHGETGQSFVVTLGADGVAAIREGALTRAQGLKIVPIDTVGAGDTFSGYLAASLDQGLDFAAALRRAAVAGSLACLKHGAQPSIPTGDEVDAAL